MNNSNVSHAWAHNREGKGSNFYSVKSEIGTLLYSYNTVIGINLDGYFITTSARYSNSICRHQGKMLSAINYQSDINFRIIEVDTFFRLGHKNVLDINYFFESSIKTLIKKIKNELPSSRAKKSRLIFLDSIKCEIELLKKLAIKFNKQIDLDIFSQLDLNQIENELLEGKKLLLESKRQREEANKQIFLNSLNNWKSFEIDHFYSGASKFTYLRVNKDKGLVETSKGINLPINRFNELYTCFKKNWLEVGHILFDNWKVQEITSEYLKSGCHIIPISEIEQIASEVQ